MILIFLKNIPKQKNPLKKKKKAQNLKNAIILLNGKRKVLHAFERGIFPIRKQGKGLTSISDRVARVAKVSDRKQVQILTPKLMLQRLLIALAQVKVGNTFENLLNEIRQIIYSLYQAKEIAKKVYNNK